MSKVKLDSEEQELIDVFDAGEFQSDLTDSRRDLIESSASETFKKDKRINIRISGRDLAALQRRALEEGLPYQTLIASILHKYASGSLYDVTAKTRLAQSE